MAVMVGDPGLGLGCAVAAGGAQELADGPVGRVLDPPADREGGEHGAQVGFIRVAQVVAGRPGVQTGPR